MAIESFIVLAAVHLATAHFQLEYPQWRADSLQNASYSQWVYPCAGVSPGTPGANRTDWPLTGGSLLLDLHHPWTYIFVNLGLGGNVTNFNYTLTPSFWNETGNGTLCVPDVPLPAGLAVSDGTEASLQVVTLGASGNALYNCADITFRANATSLPSPSCTAGSGVSYYVVQQEAANGTISSGNSSSGSNLSGSDGSKSAGSARGANTVALTTVVGLSIVVNLAIGI